MITTELEKLSSDLKDIAATLDVKSDVVEVVKVAESEKLDSTQVLNFLKFFC